MKIGLTNKFSTSEENYVAVVGFMVKMFPYVHNREAQEGIIAIAQEMISIYPTVFKLEVVQGLPVIAIIAKETKENGPTN